MEKGTSGRYRKLKKGHVTVFPNDVQGLCTDTLALAWLKLNNPLYADIRISLATVAAKGLAHRSGRLLHAPSSISGSGHLPFSTSIWNLVIHPHGW